MRSKDHAAAVSTPVLGIEPGIVLREEGVATVAENALHKIEIAHQVPRREEADFHAFFAGEARDGGANERAQEERDKAGGLLLAARCERQPK